MHEVVGKEVIESRKTSLLRIIFPTSELGPPFDREYIHTYV